MPPARSTSGEPFGADDRSAPKRPVSRDDRTPADPAGPGTPAMPRTSPRVPEAPTTPPKPLAPPRPGTPPPPLPTRPAPGTRPGDVIRSTSAAPRSQDPARTAPGPHREVRVPRTGGSGAPDAPRPASAPGTRPESGTRSPLRSYAVPLLSDDDPDADSGTVSLRGRGEEPPTARPAGASQGGPADADGPVRSAEPGRSAAPREWPGRSAAAPGPRATDSAAPAPGVPPLPRRAPSTTASTALGNPRTRHVSDRRPEADGNAGARQVGPSAQPALRPGAAGRAPFAAHPAGQDDHTTRPHPLRDGARPRLLAAVACAVLGLGLIGGAVTGSWLTGDDSATVGSAESFADGAELWHNVPVDRLFPPVVHGDGAGPGRADRTWTRLAVAPDSGCAKAFDPLLQKVLAPVGCLRLLRATYTDATRSHVTTVGALFTKADVDGMRALHDRFAKERLDRRTDLMPRPYAVQDTVAADFADAQRASWKVSVLTDLPVVVYAVSGFADGRTVQDPQPAPAATQASATTAPAQAGLGHEATGLADRLERELRTRAAGRPPDSPQPSR